MKRLAFLSFILAVVVTPVQAQTEQPGAPPTFNGLVWDPPPVQRYEAPPTIRARPSTSQPYRAYAAPPPPGFNGPYWDSRAQRYR
jgi:hypothetical protein